MDRSQGRRSSRVHRVSSSCKSTLLLRRKGAGAEPNLSPSFFRLPLEPYSTGLPLSTYFSAIKLRWMIDTHPEIAAAHEDDRLCFGTVDSWLVYVSLSITSVLFCSTADRVTFSPSPRT
jgi:hypothetical protein